MVRLPAVGDDFGRYRLLRELGRGGMGVVYAARDTVLDRAVALKIIAPQWAGDEEYRARFEREALALSRVESRHVVVVHDHGEHDGCLYLSTQLVPDGDLLQMVRTHGPVRPAVALDLVAQVLVGLEDAHRAGVVHRDVKPSNVLLRRGPDGLEAVLCDFGIATTPDGEATRTGGLVGSFPYMAPERHQGEQAGVASDLYAVGCVLWQVLTGSAPYVGTDLEVAMAHLQAPVPQLPVAPRSSDAAFLTAVNAVLARSLAKDPAERYGSARAMRHELLDVLALAPDEAALVLPEHTAVRHSVVAGVPVGGAPGPSGRRRRVALVPLLALVLAGAVAGGYTVAARSGADVLPTVGDAATSAPVSPSATTGAASPSETATPTEQATPTAEQRRTRKQRVAKRREQQESTGGAGSGTAGAGAGSTDAGTTGTTGGAGSTGSTGGTSGGASTGGSGPSGGSGGSGGGSGSGGSGSGSGSGGGAGSGAGGSAPSPSPSPTPDPPTYRCWDGSTENSLDACGYPTGVTGVHWMFPRSAGSGCAVVGSPKQDGAVTSISCDVSVPGGRASIYFLEWRSRDTAIRRYNEVSPNGPTVWKNNWGLKWRFRDKDLRNPSGAINLYDVVPMGVRVQAPDKNGRQAALDLIKNGGGYRSPADARGVRES